MKESAEEKRRRLVPVVRRLMEGTATEEEDARLVREFQSSVTFPGVTDLIFYPDEHFDHEPTAEEIVDRALAHRPIAL